MREQTSFSSRYKLENQAQTSLHCSSAVFSGFFCCHTWGYRHKQQVFLLHPETVTPGKAQFQCAEMPLTNSLVVQYWTHTILPKNRKQGKQINNKPKILEMSLLLLSVSELWNQIFFSRHPEDNARNCSFITCFFSPLFNNVPLQYQELPLYTQ